MTKEELLREEVKRLQNEQRIFWTIRRRQQIESDKKVNHGNARPNN